MTALERIEDALAKMTPGQLQALTLAATSITSRPIGAHLTAAESIFAGAWLDTLVGIVTLRNYTAEVVAEVKRLREALARIADDQTFRDWIECTEIARAALEPQP